MNKLVDIIIRDAEIICHKLNFQKIIGKTVLVAGASGLVGGYFIACLRYLYLSRGARFNTIALTQEEPYPYLKELLDFEGVCVYQGDLTNPEFCAKLPEADIIIHAAGYAQPSRFLQDQVKTLKLNTLSLYMLFDKLLKGGKFLFISSSEVYNGLKNSPFKESEIGITNTSHPRSCYIEAKRCGEAICYAYRRKGIAAKSVRLSLAYGPGTRPGDTRVMNSFIEKALNGKITLLDQGKAKRTYCYISDAIEIMWNVLLHGKGPIYNVGGNSRTTIGELAQRIGNYLNVPVIFPAETQEMPGAPDDVYLDMAKARKEFGKTDFVAIERGLEATIEWQKELCLQSNDGKKQ
ncbi:MAG: NAD-dependent epimerase/dehydratase family protein [Candidatus Omnitrophota bacterium]